LARPFVLHPSPFILHPSSFILHPSPFILHPSSFILHPSSFILHPMKPRSWIGCGAALAGLAVAIGAFGAHGLEDRLQLRHHLADTQGEAKTQAQKNVARGLENYHTAARYQMYHAFGLLAVGLLGMHGRSAWVPAAGWCFLAGVAVFSGCLYALVFGAPRWLGAVVPIGGVAFLLGWAALTVAAWRMAPFSNSGK
jgi:uncharacterized membrane protein YgdD (TMEM256/DUF423 family)